MPTPHKLVFALCTLLFLFETRPVSAEVCFTLGKTLCAAACSGDQEALLRRLPSADANDRVCALSTAKSGTLQSLLVDNGVSPNTLTEFGNRVHPKGRTALFWIIFRDDLDLITNLIRRGVDVNLPDSKGRTPLIYAALAGRLQMVRALLQGGANPNVRDPFGDTALCKAQKALFEPEHRQIEAELLAAGARCDN